MKLNERSLAFYATCDSPTDKAGFLYKKGERNTAYHRRWFVLKGNMLFYFEDRESREPVGVIILEGCTVELCESTEEFAFAIKFSCAKSRTYILSAESQAAMEGWVKSLSRASFGYLRLVVKELEKQLEEMQRNLSGYHRVQRKAPLYRKNKTAPNLELAAIGPDLLREKVTLPVCMPAKENGCALWNNPEGPASLPAGYVQNEQPRTGGVKSLGEGLKPPPLPPRRRALSSHSCNQGSLGSPVYPSPTCFSKLHEWYGKEIVELRKAWQEGQNGSSL